ncbi:hypothetical protein HOY80DRAFT_1021038 [Tuber brumale]|nr:hypothetical protein HOY80DRAFT_1021038 [Tuber brumale]
MPLSAPDIQTQLARRRRALPALTTPRNETESVHIQSGAEFGYSLGPPIGVIPLNQDPRPHDYSEIDFTREAIRKLLYEGVALTFVHGYGQVTFCGAANTPFPKPLLLPVPLLKGISAWTMRSNLGYGVKRRILPYSKVVRSYLSAIHCLPLGPHAGEGGHFSTRSMPAHRINRQNGQVGCEYRDGSNYIGGPVTCVIKNVTIAVSEPRFEMLEAKLAQALLAIAPPKAIEVCLGFEGRWMSGSVRNATFACPPL